MFSKPQKFAEKSKRVFITFKHTTRLWFSFIFSLCIINEFLKTFLKNMSTLWVEKIVKKSEYLQTLINSVFR